MEHGDSMPRHIDDKDLSPQIALGLGDYSGGDVMTWETENSLTPVLQSIKYQIVKLDGRYPHHALAPDSGTRFSLYFYKLFDRRWTKSRPKSFPPQVLHSWAAAAFETVEEPLELAPHSDAEEAPNRVNSVARGSESHKMTPQKQKCKGTFHDMKYCQGSHHGLS
uniref:Uncharacterized protein n=1 Tax=Amphora coffeiformis TaxID=265554 RepID=A0A7S3LD34_9STRA